MAKLTEQEIKNLEGGLKDLKESIPKEEKEFEESKKCLEYMNLNYYDENIEKKIAEILEFYINDLKNTLDFNKGQQKTLENMLSKNNEIFMEDRKNL